MSDPSYEQEIRRLVAGFLRMDNKEGIERIGLKIEEAFLGSSTGKNEAGRQLRRWDETNPSGRHA